MPQYTPGNKASPAAERIPRQEIPGTLDLLFRERARFQATGMSRSAWYAAMAKGEAPKPVRLSARSVAWRASDLQKWIDSRTQQVAAR